MSDFDTLDISVREAGTPSEWADGAALVAAYAQTLGPTACVQDLSVELAHLPQRYGPPLGGLMMAYVDGTAAGCCALRPFPETDHTNACEMKRLYVRPAFRGRQLGRQLAEAILDLSRQAGYDSILLDTLDDMESARALYQELGFEEIPPYYYNPIAGAHYLKAKL